jgi:hypothetical protein
VNYQKKYLSLRFIVLVLSCLFYYGCIVSLFWVLLSSDPLLAVKALMTNEHLYCVVLIGFFSGYGALFGAVFEIDADFKRCWQIRHWMGIAYISLYLLIHMLYAMFPLYLMKYGQIVLEHYSSSVVLLSSAGFLLPVTYYRLFGVYPSGRFSCVH